MKKDNKKALYESIMTSVAKEVKKVLNENNEALFVYSNYFDDEDDEDEYSLEMLLKDAILHNCKLTIDPTNPNVEYLEIEIVGKYEDVKWIVRKYYCSGKDNEREYKHIEPFN